MSWSLSLSGHADDIVQDTIREKAIALANEAKGLGSTVGGSFSSHAGLINLPQEEEAQVETSDNTGDNA